MPLKKKKRFCGAKARQKNHQPCKQPAMKSGKCRLHGGLSTGPRTPEGKKRAAKGNFKHGWYSQESIAERKRMRLIMRQWRDDLDDF